MDIDIIFLFMDFTGHIECYNSKDENRFRCVWCETSRFVMCATFVQALAVQRALPSLHCDYRSSDDKDGSSISSHNDDVHYNGNQDPIDTSCLEATVDKASCDASTDHEGNQCQFCDIAGVNVCLNPEQAVAACTMGGDCAPMGSTTTVSTAAW